MLRLMVAAAVLLAALGRSDPEPSTRLDFEAYLEYRGHTAATWSVLAERERARLILEYLDALDDRPRRPGEKAIESLTRMRSPESVARYLDGSTGLRPFLDVREPEAGDRSPGAVDATDSEGRHPASIAAGLSVIEKMRPAPGGAAPAAPPVRGPASAQAPEELPRGRPAPVADLGASEWGRELLDAVAPRWLNADLRTPAGAPLRVEYADLSAVAKRGDAQVRPSRGLYRVVVDEGLKGTEAELATKAHEMSHIRDVLEYPDARPETMGLLMEYRANLYEIATYVERHPEIRKMPMPINLFEAEVWFKARVFAGRLDEAFVRSIAADPPWGQIRDRAREVLDDCDRAGGPGGRRGGEEASRRYEAPRPGGRPRCGGMEALQESVIDRIYEGTNEGNILLSKREALPDDLQFVWDRAWLYERETERLEAALRTRYGLGSP